MNPRHASQTLAEALRVPTPQNCRSACAGRHLLAGDGNANQVTWSGTPPPATVASALEKRGRSPQIVYPLTDQAYGSRDFSAKDPAGNVFSFGTYRPTLT
jgi:hypothetical protein